jgi:hypothetical protein
MAAMAGYGAENDIVNLTDSTIVSYHDDNMLAATGNDVEIDEQSYSQISNYSYKTTLTYTGTMNYSTA